MVENVESGRRLREERERLGLSQTAFAAIGLASKGSQILYEKGKPCPSNYLSAIAAHGADVLYILTGRREQPALEDIKTLTAAIEVIEEALAKRRAALPPGKKAEVVALAYDILKGDAQGQEKVERMLRLVA
jgi:transcriptional regulator with XRE-family HTH domain